MNKHELINEINARTTANLTKAGIDDVLTVLGDIAQAHLANHDAELPLPGIGKLKAVAKPARTGRNPANGEEIEIPAKTAVKFVAARALKDAVA